MVTFPYLRKGAVYFPVVDVTFAIPAHAQPLIVKALVDSGASFSVFRAEILDYLGIKLERGPRLYLEDIGGRILGYLHHLPVRVSTTAFSLAVVFSRELSVSFNLLGRDNFFRHFLITFDELGRTVRLRPYQRLGL